MSSDIVIVMGVSGCGKTSVAQRLAQHCNCKFIDADDLHPRRNVEKMAQKIPLDDDDRAPWLERISDAIYSLQRRNESAFIACSALKKKYRDQIRFANSCVRFLFLDGDYQTILTRSSSRKGHYMSPTMLQSQFDTLERPVDEPDVFSIGIDGSVDNVVAQATQVLGID